MKFLNVEWYHRFTMFKKVYVISQNIYVLMKNLQVALGQTVIQALWGNLRLSMT